MARKQEQGPADDNMDGPEQRYFGLEQSCTGRITARAIHKPEMQSCSARNDKHVERSGQGGG
jgi:hypothetical protein